MMVAATAKDEEATKVVATLATMVETIAMVMTIVVKAKTTKVGNDIPTTRISPVNYTEGDTVQTSVWYSKGRLANSSRHLAEISKISNETRTATTSPISSIANLRPPSRACPSTTLRLLVQVLILSLG